jgi:hypothetical protein
MNQTYLTSNLTLRNQKIYSEAQALRKDGKIHKVLSKFGDIYIERKESKNPAIIRKLSELIRYTLRWLVLLKWNFFVDIMMKWNWGKYNRNLDAPKKIIFLSWCSILLSQIYYFLLIVSLLDYYALTKYLFYYAKRIFFPSLLTHE